MQIRPMGAEFFHADGRTDRRAERQTGEYNETNSDFSQFCGCVCVCVCVIYIMTSSIHTTKQQIRLLEIQIPDSKISVGKKLW